jgi:uncharacterized protein (TIGR04255 family)
MKSGRDPVDEVVMTVAIERVDALIGPDLSNVLGAWRNEHPKVQIQPPYTLPVEFPQQQLTPAQAAAFSFATEFTARYWFTSEDDTEVIQIQPDLIALNWRRRSEVQTYPGYASLRGRLLELTDLIGERLGEALKPTSLELTYVNLASNELASHLANQITASSQSLELNALSLTQPIVRDGSVVGRTYASAQRGYDPSKQESNLLLTLTSRSTLFESPGIAAMTEFMDAAHADITHLFKALRVSEPEVDGSST